MRNEEELGLSSDGLSITVFPADIAPMSGSKDTAGSKNTKHKSMFCYLIYQEEKNLKKLKI